jgi:Domain of unknown function (DUF4410)
MYAFHRNLQAITTLWLAALLLAGCAETTVAPTFRTTDGLPRPDRVLVYDFASTADDLQIKTGLDPAVFGGAGRDAQTIEDIQVGRAFAKALTDNLTQELRSRGIEAARGTETAQSSGTTVSIRGLFLRTSRSDGSTLAGFGLGDGQVRARIQIFQGAGLQLRLVAEAESATQTNLTPGSGARPAGAVETDARRTAAQVADKIADYYKRQGWIR